jgi:hypothetical protein
MGRDPIVARVDELLHRPAWYVLGPLIGLVARRSLPLPDDGLGDRRRICRALAAAPQGRARRALTGGPIRLETSRPQRRHFAGAAIFGLGWATADSCPAPIAAQLTQGVAWSLCTIAGIAIGIVLFLRRQETADGQAAKSVRSGSRSPRSTASSTSTHAIPRDSASTRA